MIGLLVGLFVILRAMHVKLCYARVVIAKFIAWLLYYNSNTRMYLDVGVLIGVPIDIYIDIHTHRHAHT